MELPTQITSTSYDKDKGVSKLKEGLTNNFANNKHVTYTGQQVRFIINNFPYKDYRITIKPDKLKKGDIFTFKEGVKVRPCIVLKVVKDKVIYTSCSTITEARTLYESKSRFLGNTNLTLNLNVCSVEDALDNFVSVYDNPKHLNKVIKDLKEFYNLNL